MPECQKIKNGGLDQYGAERFGRHILPQYIRKRVGPKGLRSRIVTEAMIPGIDASLLGKAGRPVKQL